MRRLLVAVVVLSLSVMAHAQEHEHRHDSDAKSAASPGDAPIKITINPEARVSASLGSALPLPAPCGKAIELPVKIINQGFVTSQLEARLVGDVPTGVVLNFRPAPLKGVPEELRMLQLTLTKAEPVDITLAFRARNEASDLGGRDRVHFLVRCQ